MSNQNKNTTNKKLKDLLDKSEEGSLDAFEKEALEGFSSIDREGAFALKEQLDNEINKKLFSKKENNPSRYWYAAAGLVLLIGFSVYFISYNNPVKESNLALEQAPMPDLSAPPQATISEKEPATVNDKAEYKKAKEVFTDKPVASKAQKTTEALTRNEPQLLEEKKNSRAILNSDENITSGPPAASAPVITKAKVAEEIQSEKEDVAMKNNTNADKAIVQSKDQESSFSTGQQLESVSIAKTKSLKKQDAKPSPNKNKANAPASSYPGGEKALQNVLRERFSKTGLNKMFEATLIIGETGVVKKVEFTENVELNKSEQKDVTAILKSLDKFTCYDKNGNCEYKVVYKP